MTTEIPAATHLDDMCQVRTIHLDQVEKTKQERISDGDLDKLSLIFKALCDPTRLRIVMALGRRELCVCDLAAALDLSESAVSHQLRKLRNLSLVHNRRDGPILYYRLDDEHVNQLLAIGLEHIRES